MVLELSMRWLWVAALVVGGGVAQQLGRDRDSLQGALEVINRRQRDMANPTLYYVDHFKPPTDDDGQPEEIGYGYQKLFAPKTDGLYEAVPLPESELGSHSPGVASRHLDSSSSEDILDYSEDNMASSPSNSQAYNYQAGKRSVFRERDIHIPVGELQNIFLEGEGETPEYYFENGEHHKQVGPSVFRERFPSKPSTNLQTRDAQSLVKHFGGLHRDSESFPGNSDDPDDYLKVLNSVWEKYQDSNSENVDPEDLSEADVEEILDYINQRQEKRQNNNQYEAGNEFFNSPLAWVKRDRQMLGANPKPSTDQFLQTLNFLENIPGSEQGAEPAKLLMEEQEVRNGKFFQKRFWRGNTYEEHHRNKRYPVAKRSSPLYTSHDLLFNRAAAEKLALRRKKNIKSHQSDSRTDPKVAQELSNIFSPSDNSSNLVTGKINTNSGHSSDSKDHSTSNNHTVNQSVHVNSTNSKKATVDHSLLIHNHKKRSGQKEETAIDSQHKHEDKSKKSVDWSNYFGIDRRRKKASSKPGNDEWLLDQYLKAYSLSARAINDQGNEVNEVLKRKSTDDMDAKLRAMEDMIVDQVVKFTGAHEGVTDSEEIQAVKDRVIAQLAAAYSLEKMRKALSEFKSSMAAQNKAAAAAHTSVKATTDAPEHKEKRVAVKKEKAEITSEAKSKKNEADNSINILNHAAIGQDHSSSWNEEEACPVMEDILQRCKEIANMAGDDSESLLPFCNLHQVCYLCGPEMGASPSGCDVTFLSEANSLCGSSARCRFLARRTVSVMRSLRGAPSPLGCDWRSHPCLARYLAATLR